MENEGANNNLIDDTSLPGNLTNDNSKSRGEFSIDLLSYGEKEVVEKKVQKVDELFPLKAEAVNWIRVRGIYEPEIIGEFRDYLELHPLTVEDILNTRQRPKMEDIEAYIYLTLKVYQQEEKKEERMVEQISIILGPNYLITFQESNREIFNHLIDKIKSSKGRIRKMGGDYLLYSLLSVVIDNYFSVLEEMEDKIENMEEDLAVSPSDDDLKNLHDFRRKLINIRKSVWPLREMLAGLERAESPLIKEGSGIYFRDIYEHNIQLLDTVETLRDIMSSMLEIYLTGVSNKTNEVMKVLTVIATIFIPLTFITGIYGMNFVIMPELKWPWGYPVILLVMAALAGYMLFYFKKRDWLK